MVGSDQRPEVTASYCPLSEAHGSAWDLVSSSKKVHPLFPVTAVLNKMRASGDDWATAANAVTEESCAGVAALIAGVSEGDVSVKPAMCQPWTRVTSPLPSNVARVRGAGRTFRAGCPCGVLPVLCDTR